MPAYLYMWKVTGFRGVLLTSGFVWAYDERHAKAIAKQQYGLWLITRVTVAGTVNVERQ